MWLKQKCIIKCRDYFHEPLNPLMNFKSPYHWIKLKTWKLTQNLFAIPRGKLRQITPNNWGGCGCVAFCIHRKHFRSKAFPISSVVFSCSAEMFCVLQRIYYRFAAVRCGNRCFVVALDSVYWPYNSMLPCTVSVFPDKYILATGKPSPSIPPPRFSFSFSPSLSLLAYKQEKIVLLYMF